MDTLLPFPSLSEADDPARLHELISRRAREIWFELGCPKNEDLAIWLEAEAEIRATRDKSFRHPHLPVSR